MASPTNIQRCVGVAVFDHFSENGLMALKWAHDFIKLPKGYKLCIICIRLVEGTSPWEPPLPNGVKQLDGLDRMESPFLNEAQRAKDRIKEFQRLAKDFRKAIFGKIYEGGSIQGTLQHVIDNLPGLETLIVGCAGANTAGTRTMPTAIELELLSGCSIVMAKIAGGGRIRLDPASDPPIASETDILSRDRERDRRGRGASSHTSTVAPLPAPAPAPAAPEPAPSAAAAAPAP